MAFVVLRGSGHCRGGGVELGYTWSLALYAQKRQGTAGEYRRKQDSWSGHAYMQGKILKRKARYILNKRPRMCTLALYV